jgi:hypothetical protein
MIRNLKHHLEVFIFWESRVLNPAFVAGKRTLCDISLVRELYFARTDVARYQSHIDLPLFEACLLSRDVLDLNVFLLSR